MNKASWLKLGVVVVLLIAGGADAYAQSSSLTSGTVKLMHRSVDGSSSHVLHSGLYEVVSLVGQSVVGNLPSRSGGIWTFYGKLQEAPGLMSLNEALEAPTAFALEANYPNPFNPETTIHLALPVASHVVVEVYDVLGRQVASLVERELEAGRHSVVFDARGLASGIYMYRMAAEGFEQHRTMLLVK